MVYFIQAWSKIQMPNVSWNILYFIQARSKIQMSNVKCLMKHFIFYMYRPDPAVGAFIFNYNISLINIININIIIISYRPDPAVGACLAELGLDVAPEVHIIITLHYITSYHITLHHITLHHYIAWGSHHLQLHYTYITNWVWTSLLRFTLLHLLPSISYYCQPGGGGQKIFYECKI